MAEFVSCVLATRDRPRFFRQAVRCFLGQRYTRSELIVVDDGDLPVAKLCPASPRIRYVRLSHSTPTGTKLNVGIGLAKGTVIQKLDDDDYYHPDFLNIAVGRLPRGQTHCLVGWDCFLVLQAGEKGLRHSGHGWVAGGTFCFPREIWHRTKFRDIPQDEDYWFLKDVRPEVVPVCAPEHYILVRHGHNTWQRMDGNQTVDDFFRTLPEYDKPLSAVVDRASAEFYRTVARGTVRQC